MMPNHLAITTRTGTLALLVLATGCALRQGEPAVTGSTVLLDPAAVESAEPPPERFKVLFETTRGDFVMEVAREWAPEGAHRFSDLVRHGYYDGTAFFRVLPGFVAQFGIHGEPAVAEAWREARIPDDPVQVSNMRGTVTFATAGPDTRTVQLFINLADNGRLDPQGFAPFGVVTGGMDVVDRLYAGYGEGAPGGQGPDQERMIREGTAYLESDFPLLDRIVRARLIDP